MTEVEGTLVVSAIRAEELYGYKKEAGEEEEKSSSSEDVSLFLEQGDNCLSTRVRGGDNPGKRRSIAKSENKSRGEKSTYRQVVLPLSDLMVSPMELSYPNDHLEDHEGDGHVTRPDDGLDIADHASITTGITPAKTPPQDNSDSFDDEGPSINPKADTEGK